MAWQYCRNGHGLDAPTPEEICRQAQDCPQCDEVLDPLISLGEFVLQLVERIEALENAVSVAT